MLSRDEAEMLFTRYLGREARAAAHSRAVCWAAELLASRLREAGMAVEPEVAGTLGLLHDIGRARTHDGVLHCVEGWAIVSPIDESAARICLYHFLKGRPIAFMVELTQERPAQLLRDLLLQVPDSALYPPSDEERIACFADSLAAGAELVTIQARFDDLQARSGGSAPFSHSMSWASDYLESLKALYGVDAYECLGIRP